MIPGLPSFPAAILRTEEVDDHTDVLADNLRKLPCGVVVVQIDCNNVVEADSVPLGDDILRDQPLLSPLSASCQTYQYDFIPRRPLSTRSEEKKDAANE